MKRGYRTIHLNDSNDSNDSFEPDAKRNINWTLPIDNSNVIFSPDFKSIFDEYDDVMYCLINLKGNLIKHIEHTSINNVIPNVKYYTYDAILITDKFSQLLNAFKLINSKEKRILNMCLIYKVLLQNIYYISHPDNINLLKRLIIKLHDSDMKDIFWAQNTRIMLKQLYCNLYKDNHYMIINN